MTLTYVLVTYYLAYNFLALTDGIESMNEKKNPINNNIRLNNCWSHLFNIAPYGNKNNLFHPFHYHNKRNQLSITKLIFNIFHFTHSCMAHCVVNGKEKKIGTYIEMKNLFFPLRKSCTIFYYAFLIQCITTKYFLFGSNKKWTFLLILSS